MLIKKIIVFIFSLLSFNLVAATLDGVAFSDSVKVDGKELILNGIGIRKATFLKLKVYYGALYLEQKTNDPAVFLNSPSPKQIVMHFVRDVEAKKLRDAFVEGMEAANKNYSNVKIHLEKFNSFIVDMKKNDLLILNFTKDGVSLNIREKQSEKIASPEFSQALLRIWFINARDEELRAGLLGTKP